MYKFEILLVILILITCIIYFSCIIYILYTLFKVFLYPIISNLKNFAEFQKYTNSIPK